jgi:hypothetical protein
MSNHKPFPWRIGGMQNGKVIIESADGQEVVDWIDPEDAQVMLAVDDLIVALDNWLNALDDPDAWMKCRDDAKLAYEKATGERWMPRGSR